MTAGERSIPYGVTLGMSGADASWSCTCPVGEDGEMCKHVVAVALAAIGDDDVELLTPVASTSAGENLDVARFVAGLDHDELVAIIVAQAPGGLAAAREASCPCGSCDGRTS